MRGASVTLILVLAVLAMPARAVAAGEYARVEGPCGVEFPRDHRPHLEFRTEWWYWTGNLVDESGRPFGFQLTFFRSRLAPPQTNGTPEPASPLRAGQLWMAHFAVSDIAAGRFVFREAMARGAAGLAGARDHEAGPRLFVADWSALVADGRQELRAADGDTRLSLSLKPLKPPVPHGEDGYSRKGADPASASCYYSFTRLAAEGEIALAGRTFRVRGQAWMDHEWSTAMLEPGVVGWDWLGLQLEDGGELMAFVLRGAGGAPVTASATWVSPAGEARRLGSGEFTLAVTDHWTSPASGARYPAGWRIEAPTLDLALMVRPRLADQEIRSTGSTGVTYWEGSVAARGERGGQPVEGQGYIELTGYAGPFDAPM